MQLSESRGFPVSNCLYCLCGRKATLKNRAQELCESRGGRPGFPVPNSPYSIVCGRKATLKNRAQELCESRGGRPGFPVPNSPYGLRATVSERDLSCRRKDTVFCSVECVWQSVAEGELSTAQHCGMTCVWMLCVLAESRNIYSY